MHRYGSKNMFITVYSLFIRVLYNPLTLNKTKTIGMTRFNLLKSLNGIKFTVFQNVRTIHTVCILRALITTISFVSIDWVSNRSGVLLSHAEAYQTLLNCTAVPIQSLRNEQTHRTPHISHNNVPSREIKQRAQYKPPSQSQLFTSNFITFIHKLRAKYFE